MEQTVNQQAKTIVGERLLELADKFPEKNWDWRRISRNLNVTMELVEKYPDKPWDWAHMSANPNLTMEFVLKNLDKGWKWDWVQTSKYITVDDIADNPDFPWQWRSIFRMKKFTMATFERVKHRFIDWNAIGRCVDLTLEFVVKYANTNQFHWDVAFGNSPILLDIIDRFPNKDWDWRECVSRRKDITIDFIRRHIDRSFEWVYLSLNTGITMEMMDENMDLPWVWGSVSSNPNLELWMIEKHPTLSWNYSNISSNRFMTLEILEVLHSMPIPLSWVNLSANPSVTVEMVDQFPKAPWDWFLLSCKDNMTIDCILRHTDEQNLYYCMPNILRNRNVTMEYIEAHPELPWRWKMMCINPNLTLDMVLRHPDKDWHWLTLAKALKLPMELIAKHLPEKHQLAHIGLYDYIDIFKIDDYIDLPWNFAQLCDNQFLDCQARAMGMIWREKHAVAMEPVFSEFIDVVYHPDNIEFMKRNGLVDAF